MKKLFTICLLLLAIISYSYAEKVDVKKAMSVAQNFLTQTRTDGNSINLTLAHAYEINIPSDFVPEIIETIPLLYIFDIGDENGIILVSGDDVSSPILGYTNSGNFDAGKLPFSFKKWIEGYKSQIYYAIENNMDAIPSVESLWITLINGDLMNSNIDNTQLNPLCTTTWDQSPYYNAMCPGGSVTGCVATAMAQVMKYWNHPAQGTGMHSYNHDVYGTLTANFGATTYQWSSMPNSISSNNDAIATLMYQCGVSVDMGYSPDESGAWVVEDDSPVCSESAFKNYFGYSSSLHGEKRENYSTSQWLQMMYADLDAGRPLVYAGFGGGGGHCFVCDGYNSGDFFHFNWGWGGYHDGYFHIDALNPGGTGTGGGTGGYNSGHQAIFGMIPETSTSTDDLRLYNQSIVVSPSNISYLQAFTVTADIGNFGQNSFTGEFAAFIFDNNGNVIDDVQTFSGTINSMEWNTTSYVTNGLSTILPGNYTIGVYYRPSGGNWIRVADGDYSNTASLTVGNVSDIELYSVMNISCGTTITKNEAFNVVVDIGNYGTSNFYGSFDISLYNLEGYFVETIQTLSSTSLQSGYYINKMFSTSGVNVEPGSYLLAMQHKPDGGSWTVTGSSSYPNPIQVIVRAPGEVADIYEPNDQESNATSLSVNFVGNNASVYTTGSNSDNGSDYDYYSINLPSGYDYVISARAHDSYNSGNGQTYTNDVLWSYYNGTSWSIAYDDIMLGSILVNNGGVVKFLTAPYFLGGTGTYLLDIQIIRTPLGIDDIIVPKGFTIYPNPVVSLLNLDIENNAKVNRVQVSGISGSLVMNIDELEYHGNNISIPVDHLGVGTYIVSVSTEENVWHRKFIKTE